MAPFDPLFSAVVDDVLGYVVDDTGTTQSMS